MAKANDRDVKFLAVYLYHVEKSMHTFSEPKYPAPDNPAPVIIGSVIAIICILGMVAYPYIARYLQ